MSAYLTKVKLRAIEKELELSEPLVMTFCGRSKVSTMERSLGVFDASISL